MMKATLRLATTALALACITGAWAQPADSLKLMTPWGEKVNAVNTWTEYPRPQLQRSTWLSLNGQWDYAIAPQDAAKPRAMDGKILVPFAVESSLSGVKRSFLPTDKLYYKRSFSVPASWKGKDVLLHFGAVDYACTVYINGREAGQHTGGSTPFSFNITRLLNPGGTQTVELAITDPTDTESIMRGKQQLQQRGIWYTPVSGIWQTVWLEPVHTRHIQSVVPVSDVDAKSVVLKSTLAGNASRQQLGVSIYDGNKLLHTGRYDYNASLTIPMPAFTAWTPSTPKLYQLHLTLFENNKAVDKVQSYFAMRTVSTGKDALGYPRVMLNNKPIFQYGTLDQGWWPDGLLTPPSVEAMVWDMKQLKAMGFNTIRKHIKVEPALYYYYADSLGIMLWQDMPSGFATKNRENEHVSPDDKDDWNASAAHELQWKKEYKEMADWLKFFPSITTWVVFNEGWGQFRTPEMTRYATSLDDTRLINGVSGWTDRNVSHFMDVHNYPAASMPLPGESNGRIAALGEFGGYGLPLRGHLWNPNMRNWGYKNMEDSTGLLGDYSGTITDLYPLVAQGLAAAIYTQTTDVEGEVNGLITYDRKRIKMPVTRLRMLHDSLYTIKPLTARWLVKDARTERVQKYAGPSDDSLTLQSMPLNLQAKRNTASAAEFEISGALPQQLSLWLDMDGETEVFINKRPVLKTTVRQTRHYNHYNLHNAIEYLQQGVNTIEVRNKMNRDRMRFDYGLQGLYAR